MNKFISNVCLVAINLNVDLSIGQTGSAAFPFVLGVMAEKVSILGSQSPRITLPDIALFMTLL